MTNGVRPSAPHAVVGLCFMLLGGTLVLDRLGMVDAGEVLRFWPVGLILLGGGLMIQALRPATDATGRRRGDFPSGGVIWLVLLGLLVTYAFDRRGEVHAGNGHSLSVFGLLGGDTLRPSEAFSGGTMTSVLGGTQLDLRQARLAPGQSAVVDVFALMGGGVIYVPKGWRVDVQTTAIMGGVKDERQAPPPGSRNPRRARGNEGRRGERTASAVPAAEPGETATPETATEDNPAAAPDPVPPPVEREDADAVSVVATDAPRLIVRGFVLLGGLSIKP